MEIPSKLKLIRVSGPARSQKNGKDYCFANAETPCDPSVSPWSTIRWSCVSERVAFPAVWRVGAEVPVQILSFDARDGQGTFDVAASH